MDGSLGTQCIHFDTMEATSATVANEAFASRELVRRLAPDSGHRRAIGILCDVWSGKCIHAIVASYHGCEL
jgi:hypothetical protein